MSGISIVSDDYSRQVLTMLSSSLELALEEIGLTAEGYAKRICPVDTGRLRASITHAVDHGAKKVYIGTNVEYAPNVELGTKRQKAQPFLRPAATRHGAQYKKILKNRLGNA